MVAHLLAEPTRVGEVVGGMLEPVHFETPVYRELYGRIVDAYYADDPIDPVSIAQPAAGTLAKLTQVDEREAVRRVTELVSRRPQGDVASHAKLVKREFDYRALLALAEQVRSQSEAEIEEPEVIAGSTSEQAMKIATDQLLSQEILSFEDLGRRFVKHQRRAMIARAQGIELGAYFGMGFLDNWLRGLYPSELFFLAGPPGAGKSAVAGAASQRFAERQSDKPDDQRIATLILSLEMGEELSAGRVAQSLAGLDGGKVREGKTTDAELQRLISAWGDKKDVPLYFNFTSLIRAAQLRALVVESIRRHQVGLVIIDHFRYFQMDKSYQSKNEEDEDKVTFLKQRVCKDLNVACICLAHTTKAVGGREGGRPKLEDLRGSGQIAAEADQVAFVYRPYEHATDELKAEGGVSRNDAELIYEKNRSGLTGTARFHFDPSKMEVR